VGTRKLGHTRKQPSARLWPAEPLTEGQDRRKLRLGGWALEREADEAYEERREQEQDEPEVCAFIRADLSSVRDRSQDPRELAAILWQTATRLQSPLWEMAGYRRTSLVTVYDKQADLGLWLVRSGDAEDALRLVIEDDAETGLVMLRLGA
jgi:hypothetical protein